MFAVEGVAGDIVDTPADIDVRTPPITGLVCSTYQYKICSSVLVPMMSFAMLVKTASSFVTVTVLPSPVMLEI